MRQVSERLVVSRANALYWLVLGLGDNLILNGTRTGVHMPEGWRTVEKAGAYAERDEKIWEDLTVALRNTIGEVVN